MATGCCWKRISWRGAAGSGTWYVTARCWLGRGFVPYAVLKGGGDGTNGAGEEGVEGGRGEIASTGSCGRCRRWRNSGMGRCRTVAWDGLVVGVAADENVL